MPVFPVLRSEVKDGDCLCNHCTALCCRYFSLPIDPPGNWADFERLSWFLTFGRSTLFVEGDTWYLVVQGDCKYLTPDFRCGIYTNRPVICGQYTTDGCEYDNDILFEKYFETPEQVLEYAEAVLPPRESIKPSGKQKLEPILPAKTSGGRPHFILKIDTPTDWDDFDNVRWYMTHGPVSILVADDAWHLVVFGNLPLADNANANGKKTRNKSRTNTKAVSKNPVVKIERYFESPEQLWDYVAAILPEREPLERDQSQKLSLPILNVT